MAILVSRLLGLAALLKIKNTEPDSRIPWRELSVCLNNWMSMLITDSCWIPFFPNKKETTYSHYNVSFMWNILSCIHVLQMMWWRKASDPGITAEQLGSWSPDVHSTPFLEHWLPSSPLTEYMQRIKPRARRRREGLRVVASLLMVWLASSQKALFSCSLLHLTDEHVTF